MPGTSPDTLLSGGRSLAILIVAPGGGCRFGTWAGEREGTRTGEREGRNAGGRAEERTTHRVRAQVTAVTTAETPRVTMMVLVTCARMTWWRTRRRAGAVSGVRSPVPEEAWMSTAPYT